MITQVSMPTIVSIEVHMYAPRARVVKFVGSSL